MGTAKRERQKANRQTRLVEAQEQMEVDNKRRSMTRFGVLGALVLAALLLFFLLTRGGDESVDDTITLSAGDEAAEVDGLDGTDAAASDIADTTTDEAPAVEDEAAFVADQNALLTRATDYLPTGSIDDWRQNAFELDPADRAELYADSPPLTIDTTKNYEAVISTDVGDMRLKLFADLAPVTVNNFVNLADDGYYDGVVFHRVIEDFMVQGGDPTGTGTSGPGYAFIDEVDNGMSFTGRGQLAMANAGPTTNGSQFFITLAPTTWLTGNHTIFGELVDGDDALGSIVIREPNSGVDPSVINSIAIEVS